MCSCGGLHRAIHSDHAGDATWRYEQPVSTPARLPCALAYAPLILLHDLAALRIAGDMLESTELRAEAGLVTVLRWRASSRPWCWQRGSGRGRRLEFIACRAMSRIAERSSEASCRSLLTSLTATCEACTATPTNRNLAKARDAIPA